MVLEDLGHLNQGDQGDQQVQEVQVDSRGAEITQCETDQLCQILDIQNNDETETSQFTLILNSQRPASSL